ncbi:hypothetical protein HID58_000994 [Brassica napus]|uniref:Uncharacterized protein n=1 Tax=Brassica napus TaxID=3708 RepID=A0ABQ8EI41_BRANA|nr:hypothetical protein HID58_000994 [Brassica napus]
MTGPVETAPQDDKTMKELKQAFGNKPEKTPLATGRGYGGKNVASEEEDDRNRVVSGEPTGKFFPKKRYVASWADLVICTHGTCRSIREHQLTKPCQYGPRGSPFIGAERVVAGRAMLEQNHFK